MASDFPNKTVTINVPFPPGGVADQMARPMAAALEKHWKQPVVVSNKPGAAGGLGMRATADARPDGYTVMATTTAITALPVSDAVMGRTSLISPSMFTPLARISADPLIMVVKADAPWKTFADFVKDAKANPGQIAYASSGTYGPVHLPAEMMAHAADIKLKHVAYTGGGPSITALLGGHVAATFGGPAVLAPLIKSGQLRALVGTGGKRAPILPDVPTLIEAGYPVEYYLWAGLFTSSKVPADVVKELGSGIAAVVKSPEYQKQMETIGVPVEFMDGEAFGKFWKEDATKIDEAIRRIGKIQ
jgi:tripartite-type tricarboxylate transporter receptor subunit TctC